MPETESTPRIKKGGMEPMFVPDEGGELVTNPKIHNEGDAPPTKEDFATRMIQESKDKKEGNYWDF